MACFEVIILGGLGGPSEFYTQCFMVRPLDSDNLKSICIDGGAGVGHRMNTLLVSNEDRKITIDDFTTVNDDFNEYFKVCNKNSKDQHYNMDKEKSMNKKIQCNIDSSVGIVDIVKLGFSDKLLKLLNDKPTILQRAYKLYQGIVGYYITHPHLDHISGMVLNSPLMFDKEVQGEKTIYGLNFTTNALKSCIFNDIIWPKLSDTSNGRLRIETLIECKSHYLPQFPEWEIVPFRLRHGTKVVDGRRVYSTVYLLRNRFQKNAIIFFGDTDYNQSIIKGNDEVDLLNSFWDYLVKVVPLDNLRGIFIECSSSSVENDKQLYGHLSPKYLIYSLKTLHDKYVSNFNNNVRSKFDLNIIITHVKMVANSKDSRETILNELKMLAKQYVELRDVNFYLALNKHRFIL